MRAIRLHENGGPEVLTLEDVPLPAPGPGEVQVRHTAIGLNFIDTYIRSGLYGAPLPHGLGLEACGVAEAVGDGVEIIKVGDRVAYGTGPLGAYAEAAIVPEAKLVQVPDGVSDDLAASLMLKGMTAHYLLRQIYEVKAGDWIVMHAASGGVGQIACQWANHLGATVIGTVGSEEKAKLALQNGCAHPVRYDTEDLAERVRELTDGRGVPVVYDSVGRTTYEASIACLAPRGILVSFGNASGPPPPVDLIDISKRGSLFVTRPRLADYMTNRAEIVTAMTEVFELVQAGKITITIGQTYPLEEAAQAHRDLEGRKTIGSTVIKLT